MASYEHLFPTNLYHSYIVEGDPELASAIVRTILLDRGIIKSTSIDLRLELYDAFTVADSIAVKEWHSERSIDGVRVCIIGAKFINHDAEQTLLKIIEEPNIGTHFFLVVPNADNLLGTIKSRAHTVRIKNEISSEPNASEKLLKENYKNRLAMIETIIKDHKDDEGSGSLRHHATSIINGIEETIYKKWQSKKDDKQLIMILKELSHARDYLSLPGASVKMILEHVSLVI